MRKRAIVSWAIFGLLMIFIATWAPARIYVMKGKQLPPNSNPKSVLYNSIDGIEELDSLGEEF